MIWHRIDGKDISSMKQRRDKPSISRSKRRPNRAYVMMPMTMAPYRAANVYHDGGSRIALEFGHVGDLAVRQTSPTASTVRINLPARMAPLIPFGLHSVSYEVDPEGKVIINIQTAEYVEKNSSTSAADLP